MQTPALELPPINKRNHAMTRFVLGRLEQSLGIQIRLHNLDDQFSLGGGIIVANHFTRLETFVVPFVIHRAIKKVVRILAAPMLFGNAAFGDYLKSMGALPTDYPDKYDLIARDILRGGWWLIFPEGGLIKDRKVIERGRLNVATEVDTERRPPRTGTAILAMTVQRYKAALQLALRQGEDIQAICDAFGLHNMPPSEIEAIAYRPTPIIPMNVTYYPLNPQENMLKSLATQLAPSLGQSTFGQRLIEEITVEGSMLFQGVEIDMRLGSPLLMVDDDVRQVDDWRIAPWSPSPWHRYLTTLRSWRPMQSYGHLLDRWTALHGWRQRRRAWQITQTTMQALYRLTTVHMDHLIAVLLLDGLRIKQEHQVSVSELKSRVYLIVNTLRVTPHIGLHHTLTDPELHHRLLTNTAHPALEDFARRASTHGLLRCDGDTWELNADLLLEPWSLGTIRLKNFIQVYYNEIEPLTEVMHAIQQAQRADLSDQWVDFSQDLFDLEQTLYERDYATFVTPETSAKIPPLPRDCGRPVLLRGTGAAGEIGVLLTHGYSASPGEMLALAQTLNGHGLTVYAVRLRGHGTSPYDLQQRTWQDWYEAVRRGYDALQRISSRQLAGGMSTGGALSLYLAAQPDIALHGVFAVGAPIRLQQRAVRLAPLIKTVRDFVSATPHNPSTNYVIHPVQAIHQLTQFIDVYRTRLSDITVPALLIQAVGDPTVRPESVQYIYDNLGATDKTLIWKDINRHVIVGEDYRDVHQDILKFIQAHAGNGTTAFPSAI